MKTQINVKKYIPMWKNIDVASLHKTAKIENLIYFKLHSKIGYNVQVYMDDC